VYLGTVESQKLVEDVSFVDFPRLSSQMIKPGDGILLTENILKNVEKIPLDTSVITNERFLKVDKQENNYLQLNINNTKSSFSTFSAVRFLQGNYYGKLRGSKQEQLQ
jgi:hypothetical protein